MLLRIRRGLVPSTALKGSTAPLTAPRSTRSAYSARNITFVDWIIIATQDNLAKLR